MYDTAYFGGEQGLRESYVKNADQCLEPKGLTPQLEVTLSEQKETVNKLAMENVQLKAKVAKIEKTMELMIGEIRRFQEETLKRLGDSPETIEETMRKSGSRKEDYLKKEKE